MCVSFTCQINPLTTVLVPGALVCSKDAIPQPDKNPAFMILFLCEGGQPWPCASKHTVGPGIHKHGMLGIDMTKLVLMNHKLHWAMHILT